MSRQLHSKGFTIIELMIATLVFSTVLLLCATGLISVARMYQKGNTSRATQETARSVIDQIKNDFELSNGSFARINAGNFCIGSNLYSFSTDLSVDTKTNSNGTGHALVLSQPPSGCSSASPAPASLDVAFQTAGARELLGPNMRVAKLEVLGYPDDNNPTSISIKLNVVAGDVDLLTTAKNGCKGGAGQEYCAGSVLETYATKRLK